MVLLSQENPLDSRNWMLRAHILNVNFINKNTYTASVAIPKRGIANAWPDGSGFKSLLGRDIFCL